MVEKIVLAAPRGYCAGVRRAIEIVELAIQKFGSPIYVKHHIVHNEYVVEQLEKKGAIFVEQLEEIPRGARVVFSAHGTAPKIKEQAKERELEVIDAVCPLVTKVHVEARRFHRNEYEIVLIGHKGHIEVEGTMGHAPMHLVETKEDIEKLNIDAEKIVYLTQTTLSVDDTKEIIDALKQKYPHAQAPPKEDICYATTNRQAAVKEMAKSTDLILVVGSPQSSNSNRLVDTSKACGVDSYLLSDKLSINKEWLENKSRVGITSGASVPDVLVQGVIDQIKEWYPSAEEESFELIKENVEFVMPDILKS